MKRDIHYLESGLQVNSFTTGVPIINIFDHKPGHNPQGSTYICKLYHPQIFTCTLTLLLLSIMLVHICHSWELECNPQDCHHVHMYILYQVP